MNTENLERILNESPMADYTLYTREDLFEFAQMVIEEALYVTDIARYERNEIRSHFGMKEESLPIRDIGLITTGEN